MPEIIEVEFHSKYLSDFQLSRLVQASLRKYTVAITAYISEAVIIEDRCLGVFFDHLQEDEVNRTANGGIICTTKIQRAWKEGRFWLLETEEGNYLVGSFKRGGGRRSFIEMLQPDEARGLLGNCTTPDHAFAFDLTTRLAGPEKRGMTRGSSAKVPPIGLTNTYAMRDK